MPVKVDLWLPLLAFFLLCLLLLVGQPASAARFRIQLPTDQSPISEHRQEGQPQVNCNGKRTGNKTSSNASMYTNRDPVECLTDEARVEYFAGRKSNYTARGGKNKAKANGRNDMKSKALAAVHFRRNTSFSSDRSGVQECHQCYTSCDSENEAMDQCISAYYMTCDAGKRALSFCRCEQGGWDYPYINPGGRPAGQFSWKCCFSHMCMPE